MGIILSRFRKKESTKNRLDKIQNDIISYEEFQKQGQSRKRLFGYLIVITLVLTIAAGVLEFFYYPPPSLKEKVLYISQFAILPLVIILLKNLLAWFFTWRLRSNDTKLKSLKETKKKILDEVMDTETYRTAKEILEIYAPEISRYSMNARTPMTHTPRAMPHPETDVRRRMPATPLVQKVTTAGMFASNSVTPSTFRTKGFATPQPPGPPKLGLPSNTLPQSDVHNINAPMRAAVPVQGTQEHQAAGMGERPLVGRPMPRPVLPRERSVMDRFIEYIVGDGPTNRYALICRQCESHNGMALKDEFEYLAFRCAYCFYWNPSRKQKPPAPRLESFQHSTPLRLALQKERKTCSSSEDEEQSSERSDLESDSSSYELPPVSSDFVNFESHESDVDHKTEKNLEETCLPSSEESKETFDDKPKEETSTEAEKEGETNQVEIEECKESPNAVQEVEAAVAEPIVTEEAGP